MLIPAAAAEPVATDLHLHVIGMQDMPINTQAPPDDYAVDESYGPGGATLRCLHPLTSDLVGTGLGTAGVTGQAFHTFRGYGTPSLVEYGAARANGDDSPRAHPARGVWGNFTVDTAQPMQLHWYLRASASPDEAPAPAVPQVLVRAAIRAGDDISVDDRAYDEGRLLFEGQAGPASLAGGDVVPAPGAQGEVRPAKQVGNEWVYEFVLPLAPIDPLVLVGEGFNVRVDVLVQVPGCDGADTVMPNLVAVHTSPGARPRIAWSVLDPMLPPAAHLALDEHGNLTTHLQMATVFGAYDVSNVVLRLARMGPDGPVDIPLERHEVQGYGPCGHDCGHALETQYRPADPVREPGRYELTVSYDNLQGTAHQEASAQLTIEPPAQAPGLPMPLLLAALLALALRRLG